MTLNMLNKKCRWIILLIIFAASGCHIKRSEEKELKLIWWGDVYNRTFAQKVVDAYNSKRPAIKIKLLAIEQSGGIYEQKILSMSAAGIPPDIMLITPGKNLEYASKGIFLPLDNYKSDSEFNSLKEDMWPNIWDGCEYRGKLYTVPIWTNTVGVFYNKTMFDKAGVAYPVFDWTLEDLLAKARQLTRDFDNDGQMDQFGFGGIPLSIRGSWDLSMLIELFGGHLYSADGKKCLINSREAIEAVQWAVDISEKYHICPTMREVASLNIRATSASGEDYFRAGKIAMVWWPRCYLDVLKLTRGFEWAVAPYPQGRKKIMYQIPVYLAIASKTRYPDECWQFLKFMVGKEGQLFLTQDRSDLPVLKSMARSPGFQNYVSRPDVNGLFLSMLDYAKIPKIVIGGDEWYKNAEDKLTLVVLGKLSVKDACDEIAREYEAIDFSGF
jgi:multiple sugar transport system substrate-binding protein